MNLNCENIVITKNEDGTYKLVLIDVPFSVSNEDVINGVVTFPRVSKNGINLFKNENVLPRSEIFNVIIPE